MNNDHICTFTDCQYGLDISKTTTRLNSDLFRIFGGIQYVKTSFRNDTELISVYEKQNTNVTYSFTVCLPHRSQDENVNRQLPGIYYCYNKDQRYKIIQPGNINTWCQNIKNRLNDKVISNFNTFIRCVRDTCKETLKDYCGNICIKTIEEATIYHQLYVILCDYHYLLEQGIAKLKDVKQYINDIKNKVGEIRHCDNTTTKLDEIIHIADDVLAEANRNNSRSLGNPFTTFKNNTNNLKQNQQMNRYDIQLNMIKYTNDMCVDLLTHYIKAKRDFPKYSLKGLIEVLDEYHQTHPISPVVESDDKNNVVLSQYSNIYIPYDKEYNWIDYNIHYKYYVDINNTYWYNNNDRRNLVQINTANKTTILNIGNGTQAKELSNLDQGEEKQWLIAIDKNVKLPKNRMNNNEYDSNAIQFILSYNEFLHFEPNTTPDITIINN